MLWFTLQANKDTVDSLMAIDEYDGSKQNYLNELRSFNPHINGFTIGPFTPVILVHNLSTASPDLKSFVRELNREPSETREQLRNLQESKVDIPTLVAMDYIMREFREYTNKVCSVVRQPPDQHSMA